MTNDNECCQSSERNLTSNEQFSVCGRRGGYGHDVSEASVLQVPLSRIGSLSMLYCGHGCGCGVARASHLRGKGGMQQLIASLKELSLGITRLTAQL
jgi:hypothetical protein